MSFPRGKLQCRPSDWSFLPDPQYPSIPRLHPGWGCGDAGVGLGQTGPATTNVPVTANVSARTMATAPLFAWGRDSEVN